MSDARRPRASRSRIAAPWWVVGLLGAWALPASAGEPAFRRHDLDPESTYCACAAVDVNRDGRTDLVSANYRSQTLYWIEHPGPSLGPWTAHVIEKPGAMETGRLVDVDGDDPDRVPFDFYELIGALAPRPFFANAPLGDGNFKVSGVKKVIAGAMDVYKLSGAEKKLHAVYPDCGHDFPNPVRDEAYRWLDRWLK